MKELEIKLLPAEIEDETIIQQKVCKQLRWEISDLGEVVRLRRSIDARQRQPIFRLRVAAYKKSEKYEAEARILDGFQDVSDAPEVIIVGAGPAGYFAALELIELGLKPLIFDRGKDVRARRRDLRAIQQFDEVNPHSNYCFGEGGAGTYSDGKLYTRSHKRGSIYKALKLLVEHGAQADILIDAHPHIGSNKLPKVVANIRETILAYGGEIHFEAFVHDFIMHKGRMEGIIYNDQQERRAKAVVLATGHSARDVFHLLQHKQIRLAAKPFALGVRIEHPQAFIDEVQYRQRPREEALPAASYKLVTQVEDRGVFSFCMCPGGLIVPAATAPGEIVVNGMSMSRRDSPFANSGTVVAVELEDLVSYQAEHGVFAGLAFQKEVEQKMFQFGDGSQKGPAQRLVDFAAGKISADLPKSSYIPGLTPAPLHDLLPTFIYEKLQAGVRAFGKKMKGYFSNEAVVVGAESRTSSPIRIPRDRATFMHEDVPGLFPAGEGAGYAGGIISAAMDGQNVAKAVARFYQNA